MRDPYLSAYRAALARKHRPQMSWARLRVVCRCGSDLPCPVLAEALQFLGDR